MGSIHDVARLAAVSPMTVSRVMQNHPNVRPETRARVLAAVEAVNYSPNAVARSLKQARTGLVALIVTDMADAHFSTIIHGVQDAVQAAGKVLVLCNSEDRLDLEQRYLRVMGEQRVSGIVLIPAPRPPTASPPNLPSGIPVVLIDRAIPGLTADVVRCDTRSGSFQLCQHLILLGRRRIAIVGGLADTLTWQERVAGYRDALIAAGLSINPSLIIAGDYRTTGGERAARQLLDGISQPDAIIAANAKVARGVLDILALAGVQVPVDLAIAAIDDPSPPSHYWPRITSVVQPGYAMGEAAARLLTERLATPQLGAAPPREIVYEATLQLGTSCGERQSTAAV